MKLSICVIFHNQLKFVERSINSILSQNIDFSYEIILGDDFSTDGTWEKLQEYKNEYPNLISCYQINTSDYNPISVNHRSGLNRANIYKQIKGEYFTFLDGDDFIIDNNRYSNQVKLLDKNLNCSVCAANTAIYIETADVKNPSFSRLMQPENTIKTGTFFNEQTYLGHFFHNSSCVIRKQNRNIFEEFREELFEDFLLTLFHLRFGNMIYIDEPYLAYMQQPEGIYTALSNYRKYIRGISSIKDQLKYFSKHKDYFIDNFVNSLFYLNEYTENRTISSEELNMLHIISPILENEFGKYPYKKSYFKFKLHFFHFLQKFIRKLKLSNYISFNKHIYKECKII